MDRRGALLGPEGSGPAHRTLVLGVGSVSSRVTVRPGDWLGWWLGPALTKPLVWVSVAGCVVSLVWMLAR